MNFKFEPKLPEGLSNIKWPDFLANPMIYMGLGVVVMLMSAVMLFSGSSDKLNGTKAYEQGQRAVVQLRDSVGTFQRNIQDEQVSSLANLALEDAASSAQLSQFLAGQINEFKAIRLFHSNAFLKETDELGENAWILIDMMMTAHEQRIAPLQIISADGEQLVVGMVAFGDDDGDGVGEEPAGYLMVTAEKDLVLANFNMTMPLGGYIALEQGNGRFSPLQISAYGDLGKVSSGLTRLNVAGSLFRVVVPGVEMYTGDDARNRLLIFLLGALLLALGFIERRRLLHPVAELKEDPAQLQMTADEEKGNEMSTDEVDVEQNQDADGEDLEAAVSPDSSGKEKPDEEKLPEVSLPDLTFDPEKRRRDMKPQAPPVELKAEIFRAYDIRGIVGKTLDSGITRKVGQALGTLALELEATPVVVGRDGRHSGPDLVKGMIEGISSTGCDVVDVGAVPTGVLYYAAYEAGSGSGVMITGSHNPPDYNGIKAMMGGTTLAGDQITALYERLQTGEIRIGKGDISERDMLEAYRERVAGDIQLLRPLKVVADCGNGIGGICAAEVLRSIGAEVLPMFDEVDGSFPNHHPDPSDPENLKDLISTVGLMDADLGVAFDGDADRLGVVTPSGEIIFSDRIMMLFAQEVLSRNPGGKIIYDVKCTGKLDKIIRDAGGEPEMFKTGHSLIKNRMKEVGAPFAGEMSGHFFFQDRWYGFDCGIYSAARLLEILAMDERTPEEVLKSLPNDISTPELKVHMKEGENHAFVEDFQAKARFADAKVNTIDGLRADFEYGWGLVRASNTTPILVVRFEADSEESMEIIQEAFRLQMLSVRKDLQLPF